MHPPSPPGFDPLRVLQQLPLACAVYLHSGELLLANAALREVVSDDELEAAGRVLAQNGSARGLRLRARSGEAMTCRSSRLAVRDDGPPCHVVVLEPGGGSPTDPLTGLLTREVLLARTEQALAHRRRHGTDVVLVVVDLDGFKQVNDRHGHLVGDVVLAEVGRRLLATSRPEDSVCRWGGDEFVLLLEDSEEDLGEAVCRRVEAALADPVPVGQLRLRVGASCGWLRADDGHDAARLLHEADLQMYETKRQRHQVDLAARHELSARLDQARAVSARLREDSAAVRRSLEQLPRPPRPMR